MSIALKFEAGHDLRAEFDGLIEANHVWALAIAFRRLGNRADAEDIVQAAYVRAWKAFTQYKRVVPFRKWLYRILINLAIDHIRREKRCLFVSLNRGPQRDNASWDSSSLPSPGENTETRALAAITGQKIREAVSALPPRYSSILLLYADSQGSYQEVADLLGCPLGTIRSRIHRARRLLRRSLGDELESLQSGCH